MPPKSKEFLSSDESEAESTDSEVEVKKKKKKEIKNKVPNLLFLFQSTVNLSAQSLTITSKVGFQTMLFDINSE